MKVRILLEQQVHSSTPERQYLASGSEVDLDQDWAKELLGRGEAEPIAETSVERATAAPAGNVEARDAGPETA